MGRLMLFLGYGWALLGAISIFAGATAEGDSDAGMTALIIFNMILFIFPGLIVGAIGQHLNDSRRTQ